MEQRRQAMLQLYLSDQHLIAIARLLLKVWRYSLKSSLQRRLYRTAVELINVAKLINSQKEYII